MTKKGTYLELLQDRDDLLEALEKFANCDLNENNCASLEVATQRIRNIARAAIAKSRGDE